MSTTSAPALQLRPAGERGHANHGWLDTWHTFSFNRYYDPARMGFRALRVINEDFVEPGKGFGTHPHDNMEILTVVVNGAIEHRDSMGNGEVLRPGEVQYMSAGTGIQHSEFNPSPDMPLHMLQIWLLPNRQNIKPDYAQKQFPFDRRQDTLLLVASKDGREGSIRINSDAELYVSRLATAKNVQHNFGARHGWLQLISGELDVNGAKMAAGDGLAISATPDLRIEALRDADFLLFDLD
jgi:redox-sensitive bicupin YhaK (pirin superfamily)